MSDSVMQSEVIDVAEDDQGDCDDGGTISEIGLSKIIQELKTKCQKAKWTKLATLEILPPAGKSHEASVGLRCNDCGESAKLGLKFESCRSAASRWQMLPSAFRNSLGTAYRT